MEPNKLTDAEHQEHAEQYYHRQEIALAIGQILAELRELRGMVEFLRDEVAAVKRIVE